MTTGSGAALPENDKSRAAHYDNPAPKDTNQRGDFTGVQRIGHRVTAWTLAKLPTLLDMATGAAGAGLLFASAWLCVEVCK